MRTKTMRAPCGRRCDACGVYLASVYNDPELKSMLASVLGCQAEDVHCGGCLSSDRFRDCQYFNKSIACESLALVGVQEKSLVKRH